MRSQIRTIRLQLGLEPLTVLLQAHLVVLAGLRQLAAKILQGRLGELLQIRQQQQHRLSLALAYVAVKAECEQVRAWLVWRGRREERPPQAAFFSLLSPLSSFISEDLVRAQVIPA